MSDDRPNVLVIMSDQHSGSRMGCAGDAAVDTPHLDRLAGRGVRFANAYCPSPVCGPSRMSFVTARHAHQIECWTNETELRSDVPTFAHAFGAGGYETILSGRMHFVGADQRHGFSRRLIGDVPETAYLAAGWKLQRVLGDLIDTPGSGANSIIKSGPGRTGYQAYDEAVLDATVDWLSERGQSRGERPFLLTMGLVTPHCPFVAPPDDFTAAAQRVRPVDLPSADEDLHPILQRMKCAEGVDPPPDLEARWRATAAYYGLCAFTDRCVGRVLAALDRAGLARNTMVLYTSDHGEMLGRHGLWWKGTFYDDACRVPMILSIPGGVNGRVVTENISLIDVGPTLLDLCGLDPMPSVAGRSVRPLIDGRGPWDDTVLSEFVWGWDSDDVVPGRMVVRGPWKLNVYHGCGGELFNLNEDPGEHFDRFEDATCRSVRDDLLGVALADWQGGRIAERFVSHVAAQPLIAEGIRHCPRPEPDPVWFDTPPVNAWTQVPMPPQS